jgi:hypothetical protein
MTVSSFIRLPDFGEESMAGQKFDAETEGYGYGSDSDLDDSESEDDLEDPSEPNPGGSIDYESERSELTKLGADATPEEFELVGAEHTHRIVIPDVAANTYVYHWILGSRLIRYSMQALIHFIYTGHIYFAPLKSQGLAFRRSEKAKHRENNPHLPPLCSPKSVYRLADSVSLYSYPIFSATFYAVVCQGWNSGAERSGAERLERQSIVRDYR